MTDEPRTATSPSAGPSVGFTLSQLGFATSRRFGQLVGTLGLEPRHYAVLRAVRQACGLSQQAIAERLKIPASTMVSLVDHMEQQGLLQRRPHATDRRTRLLYLTDSGGKLLSEATKLSAAWERQICAGLSTTERELLLSLLRRVASNIGVSPDALPDEGTGRRPQSVPAAAAGDAVSP